MEIYRLSDRIEDEKIKTPKEADEKTITEMKQGVKNPNRVNVFVDGVYALSLDVTQVVDFKLKVGMRLSEERLAELKRASDYGKLYQRTLEWVLVRPRSVRETRDYLLRKLKMPSSGRSSRPSSRGSLSSPRSDCGCPSEDNSELSNQVLERLILRGYLDDRRFAEWWVENRFVKKGVSRKRLAMELIKKGVAKEVADEVLGGRDEKVEIQKIIARKRGKYDDEKLKMYLCRQGFSYDLVREMVEGGD